MPNRYRLISHDPHGTAIYLCTDECWCYDPFDYEDLTLWFNSLADLRIYARDHLDSPERCWVDDGEEVLFQLKPHPEERSP